MEKYQLKWLIEQLDKELEKAKKDRGSMKTIGIQEVKDLILESLTQDKE